MDFQLKIENLDKDNSDIAFGISAKTGRDAVAKTRRSLRGMIAKNVQATLSYMQSDYDVAEADRVIATLTRLQSGPDAPVTIGTFKGPAYV